MKKYLLAVLVSGCQLFEECPEPEPCPICISDYTTEREDAALEGSEERLSKCLEGKAFMEKQVSECVAKKVKPKKTKK